MYSNILKSNLNYVLINNLLVAPAIQ